MDHVFRDVKIVNIVDLMNLAVGIREVQVCVLRHVWEFRVKMIKVAHQVNIILDCITKCVQERALHQGVTIERKRTGTLPSVLTPMIYWSRVSGGISRVTRVLVGKIDASARWHDLGFTSVSLN